MQRSRKSIHVAGGAGLADILQVNTAIWVVMHLCLSNNCKFIHTPMREQQEQMHGTMGLNPKTVSVPRDHKPMIDVQLGVPPVHKESAN